MDDKDTPKYINVYGIITVCPTCHKIIGKSRIERCENCNQLLDWGTPYER